MKKKWIKRIFFWMILVYAIVITVAFIKCASIKATMGKGLFDKYSTEQFFILMDTLQDENISIEVCNQNGNDVSDVAVPIIQNNMRKKRYAAIIYYLNENSFIVTNK